MTSRKNVLKYSVATLGAVALGVVATTATANADEIYTVQKGDTLSEIAVKYTQTTDTVDAIAQKNSISNIDFIMTGQKLLITSDGQVREATEAEVASTPAVDDSADNTANSTSSYQSTANGDEASAKDWIANKESGGSYTASNGQFVGKYQLSASYLNGDYSAANQERVADQYVSSRYGSWTAAKSFWLANGWY
ncbi:extracellular surface protein [Paucilactobacillus oligofermentans DSM 15707 = LMG 22743]|uniref:Extracellular surface protein n=1 Tax=Paucilactobacillus oligofermentans DSM 15707 = LMG 22743 TaxID=1423778 RepID=A0A0R1RLZ5_9LACO|nr:LysM domain-containing protein [Paucilactobacillus oligofermentans]KRL57878.1 extracellular surface protein [Paucilactobacillus oligofermentans DSM 15707 = LMG 22743]CUS26650.1 Peptidoglycan-binding protein [Paucilactobacillus oligofermentans DSM 15707 = LMG 22743]